MPLGIIGGTGLLEIDGFAVEQRRRVSTPYGKPSAPIVLGTLGNTRIAFLPRHGVNHEILPTEINFRANIWALKHVGVREIISVSATGSRAHELTPGSLALVTQYFDWTKGIRKPSFFGKGLVAHVSTANVACPALSAAVATAATEQAIPIHRDVTYACVEGPRFGTRAESLFLKSSGASVVGMTNVPEAFLAREANLCYCTLAVVTDYDCWLEDPSDAVSSEKVAQCFGKALGNVQRVLKSIVANKRASGQCKCRGSIVQSLLTRQSALSNEAQKRMAFLDS